MFTSPTLSAGRSRARLIVPVLASLALVASYAAVTPAHLSAASPTSVDLATYIRVGRYDLPEPTRSSAPPGSLLAQEASSVTYNWDTDTLFVVGDGGTSVVQVSKTGTLIDSMTLAPGSSPQGTEFYDTEGLTYVGGGRFVLIEERYRQVNLFTYVPGATLHRTDVQTVKLGTTIGNVGLEGLVYDPATGGFIIVKEKDPQSIFQTAVDFAAGTASNGSATATSSINLFSPALANLADFSDVFALSNLPFLAGQSDASHLLIISQESGQIVKVDRTGTVSSRLTIVADPGSPLSVPDMTMEGVTMDFAGNLYVVNENGGGDANHPQLWVYAPSTAPNQPPTAVSIQNAVASLPENTSTAAPVKVGEVVVTDDGLGNNLLTVGGSDAAAFQIIGASLYLRAGTVLSTTAKPVYDVTVSVDDPAVGGSPDAITSYQLLVTPSTGGTPALVISEVAPWSSGNSGSALAVDWFEVTNLGTATADITGWRMDDDSRSFGSSVALNGITRIAPGESVIFLETNALAAKAAAFRALWFGATPPANLQIGSYTGSGVGLSTGGDGVNLFDSTGVVRAGVTFGLSPTGPFASFDNAAGVNGAAITRLSATGINGAFVAAGDAQQIGSPGTVGAPATPVVTITAPDATAAETGPDGGTFRISRTGATVGPLAANYTIATGAGLATDADVTPVLTGVVTIPAGLSSVDLVLTPVDDALFEGAEALTLTLFDTGSYDVGTPATASVTIADDDPPDTSIVSAPAAYTTSRTATFTFTGSQPAAAIARFECALDTAVFTTCVSPVSYGALAEGSHAFRVRAVALSGPADPTPASFTWTVDTTGPSIAVTAGTPYLWPPNGKLVATAFTGSVVDGGAGVNLSSAQFRVIDEYGVVQPAGAVTVAANGTFAFTVNLEASRRGNDRDGRTYQIAVAAADALGNAATASTRVIVLHDRR